MLGELMMAGSCCQAGEWIDVNESVVVGVLVVTV